MVGEHIEEIAKRFYKHMFDARPDLLDGLFNRGNQADGRQQQALAGSIAAFAGLLVDEPDQLPDHLLSRIAHKHVSLGISPDQYQIVHDHLMWAIVDVLGDAVTPEVAAAWDEVYWLMAQHAHQQGTRPVQRRAPLARDDLADLAGGPTRSGRPTTSSPSSSNGSTSGTSSPPCRGSTSRSRC